MFPVQGEPDLRGAIVTILAVAAVGHAGDVDDEIGVDLQGRPLHFTHLFVSDVVLPQGSIGVTRIGRPDVAEPIGFADALGIGGALCECRGAQQECERCDEWEAPLSA